MVPADPEAELEAATDELYGLDRADFVAARNDLVRRLRKEGNRGLAAQVAGLRRPSPAAWAVNQLARRQRGALDGLLDLGDALRQAQTEALSGADAAHLRDAGRARREAVARLTDSAVGLLATQGQGSAHYTEIAATLEAASLDACAAVAVAGGRMSSALEPPSGFGEPDADADGTTAAAPRRDPDITDTDPAATDPAATDPAATDPAATDPVAAERAERLAEADQAVAAAATLAAALTADAGDAVAMVAGRQDEVAEAEAHLSRLQRQLDDARGRAVAARRGADRARKVAEFAEEAAAEADRRVRDAEQRAGNLRSG